MARGWDTRRKIQSAALQLFVEKGVLGTSVRDIAAAAGIAEGALYRHYASKEDLVWKLFSENYAKAAKDLFSVQKAEKEIKGKLRAMIGWMCRFYDEDPLLFRFLLLTQHQELKKVKRNANSPVQILSSVIAEAMKRGEIRSGDVEFATAQILGLVLQPATFMLYGRLQPPLGRLADPIADSCIQVLGA